MKGGDVILASIPQADGGVKHRPAVVLRELPGFGDFLVCGVSTQLHQHVEGFDELIAEADADFSMSGLLAPSLIRLGFLAVIPARDIPGTIGAISNARHQRLLRRLRNRHGIIVLFKIYLKGDRGWHSAALRSSRPRRR